MGMLACVAIVGGFGNEVTEKVPGWDLIKKVGCPVGQGTMWYNVGQWETMRDLVGPRREKRGERTLTGCP